MKLQFKNQIFQEEAVKAVVDVFAGQPYSEHDYKMDKGNADYRLFGDEMKDYNNALICPELSDEVILRNLNRIQRANQIAPSRQLEGRYNLTIEMETGVGKTYTYIKTIYELNKHYGWCKFIVIVPNVAIREGVFKSFQVTQEHFVETYGKKIRFFIYNSAQLTEIDRFASDNAIYVMIINAQAFNSRKKEDRRIFMKLDAFQSREPMKVIAATNPILIIDEPQSLEGEATKMRLPEFNPLMTLRYSATHKSNSIYNMVYRLDAMDAYNKHLVKKIAVKGITESGDSSTEGYVYLQSIERSKTSYPKAVIQFDYKGKKSVRKVTVKVDTGFDLYQKSNGMEEYKDGYVVTFIDARDNHIEFLNGKKLFTGDVLGHVSEEQIRRIQIRETILSHIERERQLFPKGIKVLSLFFIDEVAKYKRYDESGKPFNGTYADMFEEEYADVLATMQPYLTDTEYLNYLESIPSKTTHAGYFSIDKKGKMTNSKLANKAERTSDDIDAYDLIMKNKELLLDRDPKRSPVRFIFSHSALREGWDNPNVFQICTLKQASSDMRKRQEVGRGLRLCVNQLGERMDKDVLGKEVHNINVLTVIASESYDDFARTLQNELAEVVANRPTKVTEELFKNRQVTDMSQNEVTIDDETATRIYQHLLKNHYVDTKKALTELYYEDKETGNLRLPAELVPLQDAIVQILDSIYDATRMQPEDARKQDAEMHINREKLGSPEFNALWERIRPKSAYVVDFDTEELVQKSIVALNEHLCVTKIFFQVELGALEEIKSREALEAGTAFSPSKMADYDKMRHIQVNGNVKYDLIGKLVAETNLTRRAIVTILRGIHPDVFAQFYDNPEEFILKSARIINDEKATAIIQHITYNIVDSCYEESEIFTDTGLKGHLGRDMRQTERCVYDHLKYDSEIERKFSEKLDLNENIAVYVKLPNAFYITTPVGQYNPDWAIAFYEGTVKHIYFIAETKGDMSSLQLRQIEKCKIECATKHFEAISNREVVYDVVDSYEALLNKVMK